MIRRIGESVALFFARGELPERIRVLRRFGDAVEGGPVAEPGDVYQWSEAILGYVDASGLDRVLPAFVVRGRWEGRGPGAVFGVCDGAAEVHG